MGDWLGGWVLRVASNKLGWKNFEVEKHLAERSD